MRWRPLVLLLVLTLGLTACGGDDGSLANACSPLTTTSTDTTVKPLVEVPEGSDPPLSLQVCDVVVGTGAEIATGDEITVHFVGVSWSTNAQFDASWDRDEPFQFQVGQGLEVPGWDLGMTGARVGGRRELVIPSFQAHGPDGSPPNIGPNETLVYVIDVLSKDN
jgi:peptidylprolyl isomerase